MLQEDIFTTERHFIIHLNNNILKLFNTDNVRTTSAYSNEQSVVPSIHLGQNSTLMSPSSHLQCQNSTLASTANIKKQHKYKSTWIIHIELMLRNHIK